MTFGPDQSAVYPQPSTHWKGMTLDSWGSASAAALKNEEDDNQSLD